MAGVRVALVDHLRGTKTQVEIPNDVPVNRLTKALVDHLGLPPSDSSGAPITYCLDNRETGQRLRETQTLAEAGVEDGAVLALFPEVTAGGYDAQS